MLEEQALISLRLELLSRCVVETSCVGCKVRRAKEKWPAD
jgi:hypothetical protein